MPNRRNALYLLIILSLLTGLLTGRAFFFNLGYMLAGLMLVSLLWAWLSVRWVGLTRRTRTRRAQVGREFEETFVARNRSLLPKLWLEVRDESTLPGHRASYVVPALGIRGRHEWRVRTRCNVRGEFRLGPMSLGSGDPFGLFFTSRYINATSRLLVYPHLVHLNTVELPIGILTGGEAQRRRTHYITTNASGVRDYAPGDSFNRIHWRTTARKNKLMVKEFEIDPLVDIWLFPDFAADSLIEAPGLQRLDDVGPVISSSNETIPPSTEEYTAVVTASLAQYFINMDRAIGFAAYTPNRQMHQPELGSRQLTRILESLAIARSLSPYTYDEMLTLEAPYIPRGTTLILITSSLDKAWVKQAQILKSRGIHPMCVLIDPSTFDHADQVSEVRSLIQISNIPLLEVRRGDDIAQAMARRMR